MSSEKKQTRVKVVVRVRPTLKDGVKTCVSTNNKPNTVQILNHRNIRENLMYDFSAVYDDTCSQQHIYNNSIKSMISKSLNGQNVSIFAYGPTGAGKTHTMLGSATDPGMIPRVINDLLLTIENEQKTVNDKPQKDRWQYTVTFSYLEIYNEKVQDLLEPASVDLPIREDGDHNIFVAGLAEKEITSFEEFKNYFGPASNNRTVAATKLNDRSSRSHSILMLKVKKNAMFPPNREFQGKIYLIDLAGSEDNRRTGNQGIRLKESGAINKSLFVLGEVVDAINNNQPRIPYRNSKLTRLLQDSIGGSCHSIMITNIAPEEHYYYDTYCTLNFASKSKKIVNTNTTCLKQQTSTSSLSGNTSTSGEAAQTTHNFLKRNNSSKLLHENAKKPRLSPSPLISAEAPVSTDPAPLLSPLMRRQNNLENIVNLRLQEMEQNILQKITQNNISNNSDTAMTEIQRQLILCREELQKMKEEKHLLEKPNKETSRKVGKKISKSVSSKDLKKSVSEESENNVEKVNKNSKKSEKIIAQPKVVEKERKGLQDKTNQNIVVNTKKEKIIKKKKLAEVSFSPLFASVPRIFKKGFRSTACKKIFEDDEDDDFQENETPLNSEVQHQHNADFLNILNTSSIKDLQQLHTVGNKRARLIFEWRQLHGEFESVDGLKNIPTLTDKYIKNLLHSNMVKT
ncbi:hypothetical protein SNE40_002360 [Patella caerulea]|uniref:Kinesin-like protein n=1 Tax=Patella caerulea TaxID=87958 RepID=A0AAN8PZ21_PATCE